MSRGQGHDTDLCCEGCTEQASAARGDDRGACCLVFTNATLWQWEKDWPLVSAVIGKVQSSAFLLSPKHLPESQPTRALLPGNLHPEEH